MTETLNKSQLEVLFQSFTQLVHTSMDLYPLTITSFSFIQNILSNQPNRNVPKPQSVIVWPSSVPMICLLGNPKDQTFHPINSAILLICLKTLNYFCHYYIENSNELSYQDCNYIGDIIQAMGQIFKREINLLGEYSSTKLIKPLFNIGQVFCHQNQSLDILSLISELIPEFERRSFFIIEHFSPINIPGFDDIIGLITEICLSFQTFLILISSISDLKEFSSIEINLINAISLILSGKLSESIQSFLVLNESFQTITHKLFGSIEASNIICQRMIESIIEIIITQTKTIIDKLKAKETTKRFQQYQIPIINSVDFSFSKSIIDILESYSYKQPSDDTIIQFTNNFITHVQFPFIRYLNSAAQYFTNQSLGYVSVSAAFLPLKISDQQPYFNRLIQIIHSLLSPISEKISKILLPLFDSQQIFISQSLQIPISSMPNIEALTDSFRSQILFLAAASNFTIDTNIQALINNLTRLNLSWFISLLHLIQSSIFYLVPSSFSLMEKIVLIPESIVNQLAQYFEFILSYDPNLLENLLSSRISEFLFKVHQITSIISEQISKYKSYREIQAVYQKITECLHYYNEMEKVINFINTFPPLISRYSSLTLFNVIQQQLSEMENCLHSHPELSLSILEEVRVNLIPLLIISSSIEGNIQSPLKDPISNVLSDLINLESTINDLNNVEEIKSKGSILITNSKNIILKISQIIQFIITSYVDLADLTNSNLLESPQPLIEKIQQNIMKNATTSLLNQNNETFINSYSKLLKEIIALRINQIEPLDLDKCLKMNDFDLHTSLLLIIASIPLSCNEHNFDSVQSMLKGFLSSFSSMSFNSNFLRETLKLIRLMTIYLTPLENKLSSFDVLNITDLQNISSEFHLDLKFAKNNKTIYSYISLIAAASYIEHSGFRNDYLEELIESAKQSTTVEEILHYANVSICGFLSTAIYKQSYDESYLKIIKKLLENIEKFKKSPNERMKRILYGIMMEIPTNFTQTEHEVDSTWYAAFILALGNDKTITPQLSKIQSNLKNLISKPPFNFSINDSLLGILKNVKVRNVKVLHMEKRAESTVSEKKDLMINDINLRNIRLVQSCRYAFSSLKDSPTIDISEFQKRSNNIISILNEVQTQIVQERVQMAQTIIDNIIQSNGDKESISKFERFCEIIVNDCFQELGIANTTQAELILMTSKIDSLQSQAETEARIIAEKGDLSDPLFALIAKETPELLKKTKQLGREAQIQANDYIKRKVAMVNEKGLISAANQTGDAAQIFVLLLHLSEAKDIDISFKVAAACKGMREALTSLKVNLLVEGYTGESRRNIEKLDSEIREKMNQFMEMAEKYIPVQQSTLKRGLLTVQKRNAAIELEKKKRELEVAEESLKEINRIFSKKNRK